MEEAVTKEQDLLTRYRKRLNEIYTIPNLYYKHPEIERKEIETKIKELNAIIKKQWNK